MRNPPRYDARAVREAERTLRPNEFRYGGSLRSEELISDGPSGDLRARMSRIDPSDLASPGKGAMHANVEKLFEGYNAVDLGNGMIASRTAEGGVSIRTGDLRERLNAEPALAPSVAPAASPTAHLAPLATLAPTASPARTTDGSIIYFTNPFTK